MSGKVAERREAENALAWNLACRKGRFTYLDIEDELGLSARRVSELVKGWESRGAVRHSGWAGKRKQYEVLRQAEAPPRQEALAIRRESPAGNMWRAIKGLRVFTPTDVAAHSTTPTCHVARLTAQEYCQMLARAGYLKVERKAVPGRREAAYRLLRYTGPVPPRERRVRAVWDENLCEYTHWAGAE